MPSPETTLQPPQNSKTVSQKPPPPPPQEQPQKCPRCNSSNTKFCYYNNYSLAQPRHFCKTCRRYWTRGGALRNVPVGGGSRKPVKKPLKTATLATKSGPGLGLGPGPDQLGMGGPYTRLVASGDTGLGPGEGPYFGLGLMGLSGSDHLQQQQQHQISITSIESLSCINQEMHFKLQQQRLATIYGTTSLQNYQVTKVYNNNIINNNSNNNTNNNDLSRKMDVGGTSSEWLFDETQANYGGNNINNIATSISMGVTTTNISCNDNVISNEVITRSSNNLHGIWGDLLDHNHDNHNTINDDYQQQQQQRQQIQFDELH